MSLAGASFWLFLLVAFSAFPTEYLEKRGYDVARMSAHGILAIVALALLLSGAILLPDWNERYGVELYRHLAGDASKGGRSAWAVIIGLAAYYWPYIAIVIGGFAGLIHGLQLRALLRAARP